MIYIGTDIEQIERIQNLLVKKPNLLKKFYFSSEWEYANTKSFPSQTLAGLWCAKESIIKALFTKYKTTIDDIEIARDVNGVPFAIIHNHIIAGKYSLSVSISHTKEYATATAIFEIK